MHAGPNCLLSTCLIDNRAFIGAGCIIQVRTIHQLVYARGSWVVASGCTTTTIGWSAR